MTSPHDEGAARVEEIVPPRPDQTTAEVGATEAAPDAAVPTSHPIGFWFFFWGELAERCSYYGMRAILLFYMIDRLQFTKENSSAIMSYFIAASYFMPLAGGWIADNYLGKYWTIVGFSIPYIFG